MVNLWPWMKNVLGWKNSSWKTLSLPFALRIAKIWKTERKQRFAAEFLQGAVKWLALAHSQPPSVLWNVMCSYPLPVSWDSPKASHTFLYFSAFYLKVILANFNYIVFVMMLAPLGFLYVMCSSKMQKTLNYACFIRLYHTCTCNGTGI